MWLDMMSNLAEPWFLMIWLYQLKRAIRKSSTA